MKTKIEIDIEDDWFHVSVNKSYLWGTDNKEEFRRRLKLLLNSIKPRENDYI